MNIIELLIKASGSGQTKASLADVKAGLDMVTGALGMLKDAGVGAFEFAEAGATINQTRESFDDLGISIGQLRSAVNGTVPDMTLMSGTLTLTAGASKDMKDAYINAVPKLLEMAKASSKLNPTLGDTAFMYSSIATAAKRQSSQIADNLGIVVKQGVAYENYAKSINKSVDSLTDEEKQLAFLNELLASGNVLIDQAGGSVESLTDNYARLRTELENTVGELKSMADNALGPLLGKTADFIEASKAVGTNMWSLSGNLEYLQTVFTGSSSTIEKYNDQLEVQATANERARLTAEAYARVYGEQVTPQVSSSGAAMDSYNMALQQSQAASDAAAFEQMKLAEAHREAEQGAAAAAAASLQFAASLGEMGKQAFVNMQLENLNQLYKDGAIDQHTYRAAQLELMKQSGLLTTAEIKAAQQAQILNDKLADGSIRASEYANSMLTLQANIDKLQDKTVRITVITEGGVPTIGIGPEDKGTVAAFAEGGTSMKTQWARVGERGPEFVRLPAGAQVYNARESAQMAGGVTVEAPVTVYAQIASDMDVDHLADQISEILGRRVQSYTR